jgi:carbamoyl-phosphate synthase large subunit
MNVLITSVARKVWLVEAFRRAVAHRGGKVLAADADPLAVGLRLADGAVALPQLDEAGAEAALLGACESHAIGLIVPSRDGELAWFAQRKARLAEAGVTVMIAAPETVELCQDKRAFVDHCRREGLATPRTFAAPAEATFPAFARPRRGSGGRGAGPVADLAGLAALTPWSDWLVQERIDGPEFTVDLFADLRGEVLSVVPRRRLRVVAGESVVGVTVEAPEIVSAAAALSRSLGLVGHNTLQCFWSGGAPLWIEVNPRYGGGAALGFAAGADTPSLLLDLLAGRAVPPQIGRYERGLYLFRYAVDAFRREVP